MQASGRLEHNLVSLEGEVRLLPPLVAARDARLARAIPVHPAGRLDEPLWRLAERLGRSA